MQAPVQKRVPLAAVFLTALLAFQSVGWLLAWQGLQFGAKMEAHKALSKGGYKLRESTFSRTFLEEIKVGRKEIILNGQLFDYRILSETSDSLRVILYHDQHEQALLTALGQIFKTGDEANFPSAAPIALWLAQWLGSSFLMPEKPDIAPVAEIRFQQQNFTTLLFVAQSAPCVFAPPPEV